MSRPTPALPAHQLTIVWQTASLLLDYPDQALPERLGLTRQVLHHLPTDLAEPLGATVEQLAAGTLSDLQQRYVETFDNRRRHNLYLTYFAHGDTRRRGVALLRFKQTYLRSGFILDESELPDHLCVVLEYAATVDQQLGWELLLDHRAGLELLRLALADAGSAWHGAVHAVTATLPALRGDDLEAVRKLAAEGPPAEEVGLTPYGTPQLDAALADARPDRPVDLPMPTVRGA
ncbi:nitrate reductase molybdenum cofactor assembly chaperone [Kribbella shirazensis]|uniref:Nitrate reductase delta subunit n=1 Tax=Kribbella shirazensis TaxID=1105143 RepID=A0A7X5VDC6_9ACTN|nr:nitrate reductase molybdenum cofactor assembly chaperone [Kribbella shirazensis]NIK59160.1 nitrate reductase delta subunit [Kribbella shirazensis]